jgi:predicted nucleic acid-binding protein
MKTYVDANALVRLYLNLPGSDEMHELIKGAEGRRMWPVPVPRLLQFEITNSIQRMEFESRTGGQWRVTPEIAACAHADFDEDLKCEVFLKRTPLSLADIEPEFLSLTARFTAKHGFRTYDVIHIASALTLRCRRFLSFDAKALKLAKLVGLHTN